MATELVETEIDLENWITGTSYAQAKVTIYRNPALIAEYEPLLERIKELEAKEVPADDPEAGLGDETPTTINAELEKLYIEAERLHAKYESDKEVWTLRALEPSEITELRDVEPRPVAPKVLPSDADDAARGAHQLARDAYQKANEAWSVAYTLRAIERAVIGVVVAGREVPKPNASMLEYLPKRAGGHRHVMQLGDAIMQASSQEPAILAPHR